MAFLSLFGDRTIAVSPISMLPKGRPATNDSNRLVLEENVVSTTWIMLEITAHGTKVNKKFGHIRPKLPNATVMAEMTKPVLVNQTRVTEQRIRRRHKVDIVEWQQTLWRFYSGRYTAVADMHSIWNTVKDASSFLSIGERNDYLRNIAFISAIPPGRVMILDTDFARLVGISPKVKELEKEAKKGLKEPILWHFPDLSEARVFMFLLSKKLIRIIASRIYQRAGGEPRN